MRDRGNEMSLKIHCSMGQLDIVRYGLCVGVDVGAVVMDGRVGEGEDVIGGGWCYWKLVPSSLFTLHYSFTM